MSEALKPAVTVASNAVVRAAERASLLNAAVALGLVSQAALLLYLAVSGEGDASAIDVRRYLDLGELSVGATWKGSVEVRNRSWRLIRLDVPRVDCGCGTAHVADPTLYPHQLTAMTVENRVPEVPGPFERHIMLHALPCRGVPKVVTIRGTAVAETWAVPASVEVELNEAGEGSVDIRVNHDPGKAITRLVADRPEVMASVEKSRGGATDVRVVIHAQQTGAARLAMFTGADEPALTMPVVWKLPPELAIRPDIYMMIRPSSGTDLPAQTLGVSVVTREPGREILARSIVPWLAVQSLTRVSEYAYELELRITPDGMPASFSGNVLEVETKHGREKYYLRCHVSQ